MSAYSDAVLAIASLQSYWRYDETSGTSAADSKAAVTGTHVNGAASGQSPVVPGASGGRSVYFDRTLGSRTDFGEAYDFTGAAAFTALFWCVPRVWSAVSGATLWCNMGISGDGWGMRVTDPVATWEAVRGDAAGFDRVSFFETEAQYVNGIARMMAMRYDGTNLQIVKNGVQVATGVSAKTVTDDLNGLSFGAYNVGGSGFDGRADELAIFNEALSDVILTRLYSLGVGQVANPRLPIRSRGGAW